MAKNNNMEVVKMKLMPGKANPAPPVGSILGARGLNIMQFCKQFNDETKDLQNNDLHRIVYISVNKKDKVFTFRVAKHPSASDMIRKALGLKSGSKEPGKVFVAEISADKLMEIVRIKMEDLNALSEEAAFKILAGTARSMGVKVVN